MTRMLGYDQIVFASPIYWYAVSPAMKIFLDRVSDFLELPAFVEAFRETLEHLGMRYVGVGHVNCQDGYFPTEHDLEALRFASALRETAIARPLDPSTYFRRVRLCRTSPFKMP